jgi:hypothetical protein
VKNGDPSFQVSTAGGERPLWVGGELFYVAPSGALMRVVVQRGETWAANGPTEIVKAGYYTLNDIETGRLYDVASDGQAFLMIKSLDGAAVESAPHFEVVQHWFEELKRLVSTD